MKDKDIKKVLDQIQADESMKARMLENIYKESGKEYNNNLDENKIIPFKYKKMMSILAASVVLVCGVILNKNINKNNDIASSPISMNPTQSQEQPSDRMGRSYDGAINKDEFVNFDLEYLKNNVSKIEIRNHENTDTLSEVEDKGFISTALKYIDSAKEKDISENNYQILEKVGDSQANGNSITLRFIDKSNVYSSIRVNLDLDLVCINEKYYEVSKEFINNMNDKIKDK